MSVLTGYKKTCGVQNGGLRSLYLIPKDKVASFTPEISKQRVYSSVTMVADAAFAKYEFKPNEAEFKETTKVENGSVVVEQTISMVLPKMNEVSAAAISELAEITPCGLIGIVVDSMGGAHVVGYNERLKSDYPLGLSQSEGTTGKALSEANGETVTLSCVTVEKAYSFTGDVDALTTPVAPQA